jgi:Flp pilus assembly protein TadD
LHIADLLVQRAIRLGDRGRVRAAIRWTRLALVFKREDVELRFLLALWLAESGRLEAAYTELSVLSALGYEYDEAMQILAKQKSRGI